MIDYANRLIFIHVPRTGGTSIVEACGRNYHPDWWKEHAGWRFYKKHFPDLWETFRKVAVRRSVDNHRLSWWKYHRYWFSGHMDSENYKPYACAYNEWVERGCPFHEDWTECGIETTPLDQKEFTGPEEEGVELLSFEALQEDWERFCRRCYLPKEWYLLQHLNGAPQE